MKTEILLVLALVSLAAGSGCTDCNGDCTNSSRGNGNSGSGNTTGPQGPAGPAGPGIVWKDATGATADGVLASPFGGALLYIDADQHVWSLDPETAALDTFRSDVVVQWSNADCTGTPYVKPPLPRLTFRVQGETAVRVRPDSTTAFNTTVQSTTNADGSCTPLGSQVTGTMIALPAVAMMDVPVVTFVAPMHPERP